MKTILLLFLTCILAVANPSTFIWKANPIEEQVTAYNLYAEEGGAWALIGSTTNLHYVIEDPITATRMGLTAVNNSGESDKAIFVLSSVPSIPEDFQLTSKTLVALDRSLWVATTLVREDTGEVDPVVANRGADKVLDGLVDTLWATVRDTTNQHPHNLAIDLGGIYEIGQIIIKNRQDEWTEGTITSLEIYISNDGQTWNLVARAPELNPTNAEHIINVYPIAARHIRIRTLASLGDDGAPRIAEVEINHWANE